MDELKKTLVNNLSEVDGVIQKILWLQVVVIIIYGLLFYNGLEIKHQIDDLQSESEEISNLLCGFAWVDSLSYFFVKHPNLSQQYLSNLRQIKDGLDKLSYVDSQHFGAVVNSYIEIAPNWRNALSRNVVQHVEKLAQQGLEPVKNHIGVIEELTKTPPLDRLSDAATHREYLEPLPALIDTLHKLINKVYPQTVSLQEANRGLIDFMDKHDYPQQMPSLLSVKEAVNDVNLFIRKHETIFSDSLQTIKDYQNKLTEKIRELDPQKGKVRLPFIEQPVSVKLAFNFGLPILIFLNHLFLLYLIKKEHLHLAIKKNKTGKNTETEPQKNISSKLDIYLTPTFLNFLFTCDISSVLITVTRLFFYMLEIAVALMGVIIFWYLLEFLPISERTSYFSLALTALLLLIHICQVFYIYRRTKKLSS